MTNQPKVSVLGAGEPATRQQLYDTAQNLQDQLDGLRTQLGEVREYNYKIGQEATGRFERLQQDHQHLASYVAAYVAKNDDILGRLNTVSRAASWIGSVTRRAYQSKALVRWFFVAVFASCCLSRGWLPDSLSRLRTALRDAPSAPPPDTATAAASSARPAEPAPPTQVSPPATSQPTPALAPAATRFVEVTVGPSSLFEITSAVLHPHGRTHLHNLACAVAEANGIVDWDVVRPEQTLRIDRDLKEVDATRCEDRAKRHREDRAEPTGSREVALESAETSL